VRTALRFKIEGKNIFDLEILEIDRWIEWKMKNEEWRMKNEEWRMKNEEWRMKNEKWASFINIKK
jgi:hypothetical protein